MDGIRKHDRIQKQILSACQNVGIEAKQEFRGNGWRADVFVPNESMPIAFEIQLSPQSLKKTLERQSKYIRDKILGCWLFEKPIPKLIDERPDLPVFYVEDDVKGNLIVNLGTRRKIDLQDFLENFIASNIRFMTLAKTNQIQTPKLVFYEMTCWKCKELNHLYYVATPFNSSCNAQIKPDEALWESNSVEYNPEIIALAKDFIESRPDLNFKLGEIKERFSNTIGNSYMSFGCHKCDSIFGDFYVMDAKLDAMYNDEAIFFDGKIELLQTFEMNIPHWCFPDDGNFCADH
ncbi:MAG: hypothetical protein ABJA90_09410 [Ginsengibacter sp.]